MVELRPHGIGVPIFFPIDAHGIVVVSSLHLSITFSLKVSTIRVEHEIFHPDTRLLVQTLNDTSKLTENGHVVWELGPTKHRVYGLPDSHIQFPLCVLPLILDFPNHVFFWSKTSWPRCRRAILRSLSTTSGHKPPATRVVTYTWLLWMTTFAPSYKLSHTTNSLKVELAEMVQAKKHWSSRVLNVELNVLATPHCCRSFCLTCLVGNSFALAVHILRVPRCLDRRSEDRTFQLVMMARSTAPIPWTSLALALVNESLDLNQQYYLLSLRSPPHMYKKFRAFTCTTWFPSCHRRARNQSNCIARISYTSGKFLLG